MSIARAAQFARLSALQLPLRSGSFIHSVIHLRSLKHHRDSAHIWVMRRGQALQSSGTSTCTSNMTGHSVYVVTGASRGLGFEFVEQLVKRGDTVVATARNPSSAPELKALHDEHPKSMSLVTMDTSDASSVEAAGKKIAELHPEGIDVLINNAGIGGKGVRATELDVSEFPEIYKTNTIGPYLVIRALLPLIRKGEKKQIFQISSTMGSAGNLAANLYGGGRYEYAAQVQLPYRASKAALNMVTVCMAADLLSEGITVISMCPGHVRTDMGGEKGECEAPESIAGQLKVFDSMSLNDTGKFFNFEGKTVPY